MKRKHHYGYEVLSWKDNKLYFQNKVYVELIPNEKYNFMFHLKFKWRSEKTPEIFNKTNAKENSMIYLIHRLNYDAWQSHLPASLVR